MLPDPDNFPTRLGESGRGICVALTHSSQFLVPPRVVGTRDGPVIRAAVPKASVHEDRDTGASEHHVGFASQAQ